MEALQTLIASTGLVNFSAGQVVMMLVGLILLYLAIAKGFEPLLLVPIGFGAILTNIPLAGMGEPGGILYLFYDMGIASGLFPLLIFLGVGAMTDFGALIANPRTMFLGAAAQFGTQVPVGGAAAPAPAPAPAGRGGN